MSEAQTSCPLPPVQTAGGEQTASLKTFLSTFIIDDGPGFTDVEVLEDCYGVSRFITAFKT